jgi:hypothetical protein
MRAIAITIAAMLLVAGCSSNDDPASPPVASQPPTAAASAPVETPKPPPEVPAGLGAAEVVEAFKAAKLPVRNPRDNSKNCEEMQLGCLELMTTDDISVYTWDDAAAQQKFAAVFGKEVFASGNVVLSYAAARTPAKLRPRYQQVLAGLN